MKLRTLERLSDALAGDLIWRKQELSALRFAIDRAPRHSATHSALLRAGLALLYAHWEGFIKRASLAYLEYLAAQRLRYEQLSTNFLALALRPHFYAAGSARQIQSHIELAQFVRTRLSEPSSIPYKDGIHTRANLTSGVLRDIVAILGLDFRHFATKATLLDERLVNGRNRVAHGEFLQIDYGDYVVLQDDIIALLDLFRNLIENAAVTGAYRADSPHAGAVGAARTDTSRST